MLGWFDFVYQLIGVASDSILQVCYDRVGLLWLLTLCNFLQDVDVTILPNFSLAVFRSSTSSGFPVVG